MDSFGPYRTLDRLGEGLGWTWQLGVSTYRRTMPVGGFPLHVQPPRIWNVQVQATYKRITLTSTCYIQTQSGRLLGSTECKPEGASSALCERSLWPSLLGTEYTKPRREISSCAGVKPQTCQGAWWLSRSAWQTTLPWRRMPMCMSCSDPIPLQGFSMCGLSVMSSYQSNRHGQHCTRLR